MNDDDTLRIAGVLRSAGVLLEAHGSLALDLAASWQRGPRSANLEPSISDRYELANPDRADRFLARVPSDRTGEAALTHDPLDYIQVQLTQALKRLAADAAFVRDTIVSVVPPIPAGVPDVEWCSNHLRVQLCEPRHRGDLCRWCYDFQAVRRQLPPPSLLGLRHRYGRVNEKQIEEALSVENRIDDTTDKVNRTVKQGRNKKLAPTQPTKAEEKERDTAQDIADRRSKRLAG